MNIKIVQHTFGRNEEITPLEEVTRQTIYV
jgi:hypothetical protein